MSASSEAIRSSVGAVPRASFIGLLGIYLGGVFIVEDAALLTHEFSLSIGFVLFFVGITFGRSESTSDSASFGRGERLLWGVGAVAGISTLVGDLSVRPFSVALVTATVCGAFRRFGRRRRDLEVAAIGFALFGVVHYLLHSSLGAWYAAESIATFWTGRVGRLFGATGSAGWGMSGLGPALLSLAFLVAAKPLRTKDGIVGLSLGFVGIAVLNGVSWRLFTMLARVDGDPSLGHGFAAKIAANVAAPMRSLIVLPFLAAATASLVRWNGSATSSPLRLGHRLAYVPALAGVLLLFNFPEPPVDRAVNVKLFEKGFLNWGFPTTASYGSWSSGMLGMLPEFLKAKGWNPAVVPTIDDATLEGADILVIVNQLDAFDDATRRRIDAFVRRGGGLLVLGDHTALHGGKFVLNDPIAETSIRFNFDNAEFFVGGWLHSSRIRPHPLLAGMSDVRNESASVVGASLETSYPAVPLVIGRYGWAEPGDRTAKDNAWMGNRIYDGTERAGDICLAAIEEHGRGRVAVFGDTSAFSNGILTSSWPFASRVFDYLAGRGRSRPSTWREVLGIAAILGSLGFLLARQASVRDYAILAGTVLLSATILDAATERRARPQPLRERTIAGGSTRPIALVDCSHGSTVSYEGIAEDGISGLLLNLVREGWLAASTWKFDPERLAAARLMVVVAPTRAYRTDEVDRIERFVDDGGALLVSVGWDESSAVEELLKRFDLAVENLPLGRAPASVPGQSLVPEFWEAWSCLGGEPLAEIWGKSAAVRRRFGKGQVVLIADSDFFHDKNIEKKEGANMPNILFLRHILDAFRPESGTATSQPSEARR